MITINDCYIAEYYKFNNEMKLPRFVYGNDAENGRDSNDI